MGVSSKTLGPYHNSFTSLKLDSSSPGLGPGKPKCSLGELKDMVAVEALGKKERHDVNCFFFFPMYAIKVYSLC